MKEFSKYEIATIKRTAQNVSAMVTKKNKLKEKIEALQAEYNSLVEAQEQFEAPIKGWTGGYGTEDLVEKVVKDSGKNDEKGQPIKTVKFVLKYPETVIPPAVTEEIQETVVTE